MYRTGFILILVIFIYPVYGQEDVTFFKNADRNARFEAGVPVISPYILPAYSTEMDFHLSVGTLLSFKTKRNNPYLSHSFVPVTVNYNFRNSLMSRFSLYSFWFDDRLQFNFLTCFDNMDDDYWGIGMEQGNEVEKGENTTAYHRKEFSFYPEIVIRIVNNVYAGLKFEYNSTDASSISTLMEEDIHILEYGTNIHSSGPGFLIKYDSRTLPQDPEKGLLFRFEGIFFRSVFGSDYNFDTYKFDYRQYIPVVRKGSKLAWQMKGRIGTKNIPWTDMTPLGGVDNLRGFHHGQYRDRSGFILQVEYRHSFYKINSSEISRHGIVYWIGTGTVFEEINNIKYAIFSTGFGYRYRLQPYMNLRLDIGFSPGNFGIYIGLNEAF